MANNIALASKFTSILDALYWKNSVTSMLDGQTQPIDFAGVNVVKVYKITTVGMGTYSRNTGYPVGDVVGAWETLTLAAERGREFNIDRMDNEESLGMAFGKLAALFIREQVAPEVDAYRFAKYASWANISTVAAATLTSATVIAAIDGAAAQMDSDNVPADGRLLFVSLPVQRMLEGAVSRQLANENSVDRRLKSLDGVTIVPVPAGRFYTAIDLVSGANPATGGYAKAAGGVGINFMLIYPEAVLQATKLAQLKIFSPDENQDMDAWKMQYRLYHDAFVYDNKVDGIFLHKALA